MLDRDLAELYGVKTKVFKQAVKRNMGRFPADFMFELSKEEFTNWRSQFVTSKSDSKGLRWRPFAFTENGVAMLSSVLRSKYAVNVNIQIMRAFTKLRRVLTSHVEVSRKLKELEQRVGNHDTEIKAIFEAIRKMVESKNKPSKRIGFI